VKNAQYASLPSDTQTRWYSLWKLVRNAVTLREQIQCFWETDHNQQWARFLMTPGASQRRLGRPDDLPERDAPARKGQVRVPGSRI
jgi:hypothetical protein